jgi:RND family efflux transporter MFP subunit
VEEVMVKEGESVKKGQLLVKLDASGWEKKLAALQTTLLTSQINLKTKEKALSNDKEPIVTTGREISVVTLDPLQIELDELQVKQAQTSLEDAQKALDEAKSASPQITAPFDGFIIKVNISGGDVVQKGTVAVTLADPSKFQADILVSEKNIFQVNIGGDASVQVDAIMLNLPAKITYIAPTATIQSGVVNYKVTVELQSLQPVSQSQSGQSQRPQSTSGSQAPSAVTQAVQLREGMSVTISIVITQKNNVLLMPNQAISRQGGKTVVNVLKNGLSELRPITTGISDWQYTEVTDGISEGEQVIIPKATATTTTSGQQRQPSLLPGRGGMVR